MKTTLEIQNLKCGGCEKTIINRLSKIKGIDNVFINHKKETVELEYSDKNCLKTIRKTLSKLGYPVVGETNNISKKATSYVSCAIGKIQS